MTLRSATRTEKINFQNYSKHLSIASVFEAKMIKR